MPKYRLLSIDELQELEQEFVDYLILNGITADDWVDIKKSEPENASSIIELFSDVVFESIMRKTQFLELRSKNELKAIQCLKDKFVLVGLKDEKKHDVDFLDKIYLHDAISNPPSGLEVYTCEVYFEQSREQDIFDLTQRGFVISDGNLFKSLCLALPQ